MASQHPGELLAGRYRVVRRLGSGGMATVLLAEDEKLGRHVAVKRMHAESPDEIAKRFQREAQLGASLNHPNVVGIFDIEVEPENVLIVMEYVEGGTLKDALARGPLDRPAALKVLKGVAAALDHAHEHGVVHRDVKPANVLIDRNGRAKLADLGIATAAEVTSITRTGAVLGTASYMPPERLEGEPGGPPADIYALAAVAFETLTGHRARSGRTPVEIARQAIATPPPDVREYLPDAPPAAVALLQRGMARDPEERPASAGEFVAELERALDGEADGTAATEAIGAAPPDPRHVAAVVEMSRHSAKASSEAAERAGAAAGGGGPAHPRVRRTRRPPPPSGRRSRGGRSGLAGPGVAGLIFLIAIGYALGGLGGGSDKSKKSDSTAQHQTSTPSDSTGTSTGPQGGSGGSAAANSEPDGAVKSFYELAAAHDFDGAWKLAGPGLRGQLQGRQSFENTFATLKSIKFPTLKVASRSDIAAVVSFKSVATHTDHVDHCQGSVQLTNDGSGWVIQRLNVADCTSSTASAGAPPAQNPGKGPAGGRPVVPGKDGKKPKKAKNGKGA